MESAHFSDIVVGTKLKGLRPLLKVWLELIREYCSANRWTDNPWWYNERANIGLLAGAAWRAGNGWHSLEEFPTTKRFSASGTRKKINPTVPKKGVEKECPARGRCDLYVSHSSNAFAIEAKQAWVNLAPQAKADRVAAALKRAMDDAGNLHAGEADTRVAAVFVVPFVPTKMLRSNGAKSRKSNQDVDAKRGANMFAEWLESLEADKKKDKQRPKHKRKDLAYAYFYTRNNREFINEKGDRLFPGIAIVLQRCKTGRRRQGAAASKPKA